MTSRMGQMTSRPTCILVIDDSKEYLGFMEALLTSEGFRVEPASSVEAARELLATIRPDLVISDVRMPGTPPFGILDLIDASEKTRGIPVLICTGAVQEVESAADRLKQPRRDVLFKPFDIDELLARVTHMTRTNSPH